MPEQTPSSLLPSWFTPSAKITSFFMGAAVSGLSTIIGPSFGGSILFETIFGGCATEGASALLLSVLGRIENLSKAMDLSHPSSRSSVSFWQDYENHKITYWKWGLTVSSALVFGLSALSQEPEEAILPLGMVWTLALHGWFDLGELMIHLTDPDEAEGVELPIVIEKERINETTPLIR